MKVLVQWQACVTVVSVQMVSFLQQWLHEVNDDSLGKRKLLCSGGYVFFPHINLERKCVTAILTHNDFTPNLALFRGIYCLNPNLPSTIAGTHQLKYYGLEHILPETS